MAYAEKTSVSVAKTKEDIEEMVQRYGADQFVSGYKADTAVIGFSMAEMIDIMKCGWTKEDILEWLKRHLVK